MTYQEAIKQLLAGAKVKRPSWNCHLEKDAKEIIVIVRGKKVIYEPMSHDSSASDWYVC